MTTHQQRFASLVEVERALYSDSLADFIRGPAPDLRLPASDDDPDVGARCAWDIIEPGTPLDWSWHLDAVCEHLEAVSRREIRELLIEVPPRTLKTTTVSICWPAWEWTSRPASKFLGVSHDADLAIDIAVMGRRILEHPWYQRRWGAEVTIVSDQNVKSYYRNARGGTRRSLGIGGSPTGKGADILLADDPIDAEKSMQEVVRQNALSAWKQLATRLNDPRTGRKVVVMQRVHEDDVAGWCREQGYTVLSLPNEYDPSRRCVTIRTPLPTPRDPEPTPVQWADPREREGELLFPARLDESATAGMRKTLGSFRYESQYNQATVADNESAWFPTDGWQLWHALPALETGHLRRPDVALVSWDMTFTGKRKTPGRGSQSTDPDWVVGQLWYAYGAETFLIDRVTGQWAFSEAKRQVVAFHQRCSSVHPFAPTRHVVERKANGEAILDELRPVVPGLVGFNPDPYGDKVARALAVQPRVEAGQVWLPAKAPWLEAFRQQFRAFPTGKHDDEVDAFSQAHLCMAQSGWRAL